MTTRQSLGRHSAAATARPSSSRHSHRAGSRRRRRVVAAAVGVTLVGGGVALAAWSVSGTGPSNAKAITADKIEIDDAAAPTAQLYPGGRADITFRVRNPLDYPVTLNEIEFGAITPSGSCPVGSVVPVTGYTMTPLSLTAGQGFTSVTLPKAVEMVNSITTDDCKGATFSVSISLSGVSA